MQRSCFWLECCPPLSACTDQAAPDPCHLSLTSFLSALQSPRSRSSPRRRARRQASACRLAASAPAIADKLGCGGCAGHTPMQPLHSSGLVPARGTSCIAHVSPPPWGPACLPHPALSLSAHVPSVFWCWRGRQLLLPLGRFAAFLSSLLLTPVLTPNPSLDPFGAFGTILLGSCSCL